MLPPERELEFLKFLDRLSTHLKQMRDTRKALRHSLRDAREFLTATHGCLAVLQGGPPDAHLLFAIPKNGPWDLDVLARFIRHERPQIPDDLLIAPLRRRGGPWAALALMRPGRPYDRHEGRLLARIAAVTAEAIQLMDRERMLGVRDRIDRKIMEQLHPKDLFYQILDGLRSLTRYDHSSALLIRESGDDALQLVAEQIAWTKAKSQRIGIRRAIGDDVKTMLESGEIHGFDRRGERWHEWTGKPVERLAELLDYNQGAGAEDLREGSMLCAPLVTRDGVFGVMKVAARNPGSLTSYDAELIEHFRSQAAVAIDVLNRTESLQARMLTAERKHAMAELARSVSHDVNNALGSVIPLVQQMQDDVRQGKLDPLICSEDLEQVQKSLQVCRRIFGGMLSFARAGARRTRYGHVRAAVETALAILKNGIDRRGINLVVEIPDDLPPVACVQSDLEQVLLNLLTNAREASPQGGRLMVRATRHLDTVEISIVDTGCGIASEHLPKVLEPFFTTKANGSGLGLTICRSILWEAGGTISIQSESGKGTCVDVAVPRVSAPQHPLEG
jgi:two-component system, NtrC family, sensor kinase